KESLGQKFFITALLALFFGEFIILGFTALKQPKTFVVQSDRHQAQFSRTTESKLFNLFFPQTPRKPERPLNILILGRSGEGYLAPDLTDSIMILRLTPQAEAALISIPRDIWVKAPKKNYYSKINALYNLDRTEGPDKEGFEMIKNKIQEITGLDIDYYALVDITALKELVDILGGIDVYVENKINDRVYQYLTLEPGWHHLDGRTVQKYVRTRMDSGGDFARIKRQQQVIKILKEKIFGLNPLWDLPKIIEIYRTVGRNVKTDIGLAEMQYFLEIAEFFKDQEFKNLVIDHSNTKLLVSSSVMTSGGLAYILTPKAGLENYNEIKKYIADNL
ncbi:MAG: LCP family protein, partial [bacterium]|nr:LCP family protein [bacterium]